MLEGITTTIDLHKKILNHKKFIDSDFDTNWLGKKNFTKLYSNLIIANHKLHDQMELRLGSDANVQPLNINTFSFSFL